MPSTARIHSTNAESTALAASATAPGSLEPTAPELNPVAADTMPQLLNRAPQVAPAQRPTHAAAVLHFNTSTTPIQNRSETVRETAPRPNLAEPMPIVFVRGPRRKELPRGWRFQLRRVLDVAGTPGEPHLPKVCLRLLLGGVLEHVRPNVFRIHSHRFAAAESQASRKRCKCVCARVVTGTRSSGRHGTVNQSMDVQAMIAETRPVAVEVPLVVLVRPPVATVPIVTSKLSHQDVPAAT
ncbi:MAG: hypothetical protein ACK58T_29260 [Phycisphaerae bacterium]